MKLFSGTLGVLRLVALCVVVLVALGYFCNVRAQESNNPRTMRIPLRPMAPLSSVVVPPVFGIEGILADKTAAIQLGKALFWDMQAGSDDTQACASCHFNAGADSRPMNLINPGQAGGDNTFELGPTVNGTIGPNYLPNPGSAGAGFGGYHDGDYPFHKLADVDDRASIVSDLNDVSGSQGVFASANPQVTLSGGTAVGSDGGSSQGCQTAGNGSDDPDPVSGSGHDGDLVISPARRRPPSGQAVKPTCIAQAQSAKVSMRNSVESTTSVPDPVFSYPDPGNAGARINTRRTTGRNTPSVVDAVFNFRNFWDGRAQNICNGNNPFGARDKNAHLLIIDSNNPDTLLPAFVAMKNSALCSQALGPILSAVEMSADGRDFHQVGKKMLARIPLAQQQVDPSDSVLGPMARRGRGLTTTYSALIQKAFVPEWWSYVRRICVAGDGRNVGTIDPARHESCPSSTQDYSQMEYNFSLFWGVAIQMYESTLIADQTPLDKYLEQQKQYTLIGDTQKQQFTVQLSPNIDPFTFSMIEINPHNDFSDSDVYAFDNGFGVVEGVGVTQATIDYTSGTLTVFFDVPPKAMFPIKISYSVGPTPLTVPQLRGLLMFETKGKCVACHGGPELSNAAVQTVTDNPYERMFMGDFNIKVYDNGYYHIGVRPGEEDPGLGGTDPISGQSLSASEIGRQLVCKDPSQVFMVPGRPGDGIPQAALSCGDEISSLGFFKAPQLRNVALTAPYFHNGSQLTLEQVVEYYNRGGDFNSVADLKIMDTDIGIIGFTLQEKQDLVDFLRNGLTDPRTVAQSAPFDHPELTTPNGEAYSANGYPVQKDPNHKGQALDNHLHIPATGKNGGEPLPTFLENLLSGKAVH
ncbi:MAG TPA: cytochrome c peroxidase [Candidatus Angelobacter sp.]|nr:cytochrome c peroxidase [Candidatus Angelobacter sp.]